jgi:DoxX-like family
VNVVLWVLAGVLALAFLAAGGLKLTQPKEKLAASGLAWTEDYSARSIKGIGTLEVLGAIGLILPALLGIATVLVPLAATGLVLVMVGAAITHARRGETPLIAINVVLLLLAAVVAWGRFGTYAF